MPDFSSIIKREFEAASGATVATVEFIEETIRVVTTRNAIYYFEAGSDDDYFEFVNIVNTNDTVTFDIPEDYVS